MSKYQKGKINVTFTVSDKPSKWPQVTAEETINKIKNDPKSMDVLRRLADK